ncbi:type II toxin-antitoxin system HicA family toxin [Candidatus Gracilibacteria bacterium]|nr:type II toxin-antitoxin system HicA family toxin [Candidatus Gracilibacteria bacterium]MCF7856745.1 type II toxin-antitoxin system HicA family toxin [Candidatus Gracilibacteria bacterium]MCF7897049.1 type II toxin-antitoxin system HicA family toxin [Candidatus Gracilibacteria bacterium]
MSKLPVLTYRQLAVKLRQAGFELARTGKHDVYFHRRKNLTVPLPRHTGDVPKGLLRVIISEMSLSVVEFTNL